MADSVAIPHPDVPEWLSGPTSSDDGQYAVWDTDNDVGPFKIVHNRDFMMNGDQVDQDYNFIDYLFGDPSNPILARMYLDSPREISVSREGGLDEIPESVMVYLKKRFHEVSLFDAVVWAS